MSRLIFRFARLGNIHVLCSPLIFFKINFFVNFFECQTDWIQIRPDVLSGLILVQTCCKSCQQTILGNKELKVLVTRLNHSLVTFEYFLLKCKFVRMYGMIIHELKRMDYLPYIRTNHTIPALLHQHACALCAL